MDRICVDRAKDLARMAEDLPKALSEEDPATAMEYAAQLVHANEALSDLVWLRALFMNKTYPQVGQRMGFSASYVRARIDRAAQRFTLNPDKPLEAALDLLLEAQAVPPPLDSSGPSLGRGLLD